MDDTQSRIDQINERVIENYQNDEQMMILIFAQWCINNDVDAVQLYEKAYPQQGKNKVLKDILSQTIPKEEAEQISDETVLNALQLFGNDDLAFGVQEIIENRKPSK